MSRRSRQFEQRAPERMAAREQRRDQDFERYYGGGQMHRSVRAEQAEQQRVLDNLATLQTMRAAMANEAPYDPVRGKTAILGKVQSTHSWPFTPEEVAELARGLIVQMDPFNPEIAPPVDGLSIVCLDTPAMHDHRGLGLTHGTITVSPGRASVQPFEEPGNFWS
jgi:hypothetical protein